MDFGEANSAGTRLSPGRCSKAACPPVGRMEMPANVDKDDLSPTASRRQAGDENEWSRSFLGPRRLM